MTENTAAKSTAAATKTAAPRKTAAKPAAKKAPAKAAAKAPAKTATVGKKIRWAVGQVFPNGKDQAGTGHGGTQYAIARDPKTAEFVAVVKSTTGKTTELVRGSFSAAYWATVNHNKAAVAKATERTAAKATAPAADAQVA